MLCLTLAHRPHSRIFAHVDESERHEHVEDLDEDAAGRRHGDAEASLADAVTAQGRRVSGAAAAAEGAGGGGGGADVGDDAANFGRLMYAVATGNLSEVQQLSTRYPAAQYPDGGIFGMLDFDNR